MTKSLSLLNSNVKNNQDLKCDGDAVPMFFFSLDSQKLCCVVLAWLAATNYLKASQVTLTQPGC